jgi:hypothetical protein
MNHHLNRLRRERPKLAGSIGADTNRSFELEQTMKNFKRHKMIGTLFAAGVSFLFSVFLWFGGQKDAGLFVAVWVPSILSFGALMNTWGNQQ